MFVSHLLGAQKKVIHPLKLTNKFTISDGSKHLLVDVQLMHELASSFLTNQYVMEGCCSWIEQCS